MSRAPSIRIELRVNARRFPHLYRFVSGAGQGEATELIRRFLESSLAEIAGTPPLSIPPEVQAVVAPPIPVSPDPPPPPAPEATALPAPPPAPGASADMDALRRELAQRLRFTSGGDA